VCACLDGFVELGTERALGEAFSEITDLVEENLEAVDDPQELIDIQKAVELVQKQYETPIPTSSPTTNPTSQPTVMPTPAPSVATPVSEASDYEEPTYNPADIDYSIM
jgi:hypothetical protein